MAGTDTTKPASAPTSLRRRGAIALPLLVVAMIAGLVVVAVNAEGRELSRTTSNDGGAWVVNRGLGAVGHMNRATGEVASNVRLTDRPTVDVFQADDAILVHDPVAAELLQIDPRSGGESGEPTRLPEFTTVRAVEGAAIIERAAPFAIWRFESVELKSISDVGNVTPLFSATGSGHSSAAPDGTLVVIEDDTGELSWISPNNEVGAAISLFDDVTAEAIADVTIVEASAIVLLANGDILIVDQERVTDVIGWSEVGNGVAPLALLQQPVRQSTSPTRSAAAAVVGVTAAGQLVEVQLGDRVQVSVRGALGSRNPVRPLAHRGCIYGVAATPPVYGAACDEDFSTQELGETGPQLRLRLVNGWVWVTDVESGITYVTDQNLPLEALDDWSSVEDQVIDERDDETEDDATPDEPSIDAIVIDDPDAAGDVADGDAFDPSELNVPPVAIDDEERTRVDRALVVDVLENDFDANQDILVVTSAELVSGEGRVSITPDGAAVQVVPAAGYSGTIAIRYAISDGRSSPVSAQIGVTVVADETSNLAPIAETDVVTTAPGQAATVNLLSNDSDPDGDAIALASVEAPSGTLRWDPSGLVTFAPDTTTETGWIELAYVVIDENGARTEGLMRVEIRDRGTNQEPDARNDQATTIVGRSVTLNLLENDTDPDGDPLFVGSQPRLLDPEGADVSTSVTPDGEFVFLANEPGTYVFSYTVNDAAQGGSESDTARIRIDVLPAEVNQPPTAVRDDIVLPVGEPRSINVLENDGDPDGDIVTIVDWTASQGLLVTELDDGGNGVVGFILTIPPGSGREPTLSYSISDGVNAPVSAPVVIAVVDQPQQDQPPVANNDVIEARAGTTVTGIDVLANDFDPEGGALEVLQAATSADVTVTVSESRQSLDLVIPQDLTTSFTIVYDISDEGGNQAAAVLRVQLIPLAATNRPPVARTDEARVPHNQFVLIDVLRNDSDPDNETILLEGIAEQPANGVASEENGLVRYQPDAGFSGTDVFRYTIVDAAGARVVGQVFVGVAEPTEANLPPIANDDSYTLSGQPVPTSLDVLDNDFDPEGQSLQVIAVGQPALGEVRLDQFGGVEYSPPSEVAETTTVTFGYTIRDNAENQARATVTVTLEPFLAPTPTPTPTPAATPEPTPTPEDPDALLAPDERPTPTPEVTGTPEPTPTPTTEPTPTPTPTLEPTPTATPEPTPTLEPTTTPEPTTTAEPEPTTTAEPEPTGTPEPTPTTEPTPTPSPTPEEENSAPEVQLLSTGTTFETAISLDLSGQASDPDGDDLFFFCCQNIRGGTLSNVTTGANAFTVTFTPDDGFSGPAGFSYTVDDQRGEQRDGSVSITVDTPENRAPVTTSDTVQIPQGVDATVDLSRLSGDPDDDPVTRTLVSEPGGGISVAVGGDTAVVTVGRAVPVGPAGSFTYEVSDGVLATTGTVDIEVVAGANTPPTASATTVELAANASTTINLADLTTETDPGDSLTYALTGTADPLVATLNDAVLQIGAPIDSADTVVTLGYIATDTRGAEAAASITVTVVEPTAPLPEAIDDIAEAERNRSVTVDVLANDVDPLGQSLTITSAEPTWGTANIAGESIEFLPGDQVGTATVTYQIRDAANRPATGQLVVTTTGVPDQPSAPSVNAESRQVTVTWSTPVLNGSPLVEFVLTSSSGDIARLTGNSHTFTGLTNGEDYTFTVVAINEVGASLESLASLIATPNQAPETPAPPTVEFRNSALQVSWAEPTNDGSEITLYEVEIGPGGQSRTFAPDQFTWTWPNLTNGDEYTFRVRAQNQAGWSLYSQPSTPERPLDRPDAPVIGTAQRTGLSNSLTVSWARPPSNNGDGVSAYRVQISSSREVRRVNDSTARDLAWSSGLTDGERVQFRVSALNRGGWSDWSSWSNLIESCSAPDPVTGIQATRGDRQADLTWSAPDDNGCGITNYVITSSDGTVQNSSSPGHPFTGLRNGTSYSFTIRATNEIGSSVETAASTSNNVTPAGPPLCAVSGALSSSINAAESVDLNWAGGFSNNGSGITDYLIDQGTGFQSVGASAESTRIAGLSDGTAYSFAVRAENAVGVSATCGTTTATTWAAPTNVALTASYDSDTDTLTVDMTGGRTLDGATNPRYTITIDAGTGNASSTTLEDVVGEPNGRSHDFAIISEPNFNGNLGHVAATVWACNAAHCVTNSAVVTGVSIIDPPGVMTAAQIDVSNFQHNTRRTPSDDWGTHVFMLLFEPDDDGGSPITSFAWEARRTDWSGTTAVQRSPGTIPNSGAGGSWLFYDWYHGHSSHFSSSNRGQSVTWEVRAAAISAAGQGDWSEWVSTTPPLPPATLSANHNPFSSCPGGLSSCVVVDVLAYGFEPNALIDSIRVIGSTQSGGCTNAFSAADGGFSRVLDCNFIGGIAAPNTYRVELDGVVSNQTG